MPNYRLVFIVSCFRTITHSLINNWILLNYQIFSRYKWTLLRRQRSVNCRKKIKLLSKYICVSFFFYFNNIKSASIVFKIFCFKSCFFVPCETCLTRNHQVVKTSLLHTNTLLPNIDVYHNTYLTPF